MDESRGSVVTGGSGAIGLAVARQLGARGPVGIVDISREGVARALAVLEADGITAFGAVADVSVEDEAVAAFVELGELVRPRVLVTAAGDVDYHDPLTIGAEQFLKMLSVHVLGTYLAARTLHPYLATGAGRIIAIGSLAAHQGSPMHFHYAAAKAGIEGLIRSMASAWLLDDIRANTVVPGTIRTPIFDRVPEEVRATYLTGGRTVGEPEDIAAAVAYLADELAGRYVNGTTLHVDCGSRLAVRPES
jgi:NAD(P)-dependent dehydrogenase (short-subunit alcohol dehydrogenase family)